MNHSFDACAMIAYLRGEPGGTDVDGFLNTSVRQVLRTHDEFP